MANRIERQIGRCGPPTVRSSANPPDESIVKTEMLLDPRFATYRFLAVAINALGIEPTGWDAMRG